jgi:FAD dependent oxidoreductase
MKCDVLVLGGGGAGLAAAVSAARMGAHTVLVERHGALGGMATAALVHSICGLYLLREEPGAVLAHHGLPAEFAARLIRSGAASGPVRMGRLDVLPHSPPGLAGVADDLAGECASLEVRLHTECLAVGGAGRVESVELSTRGQRRTLAPRAVVEASGDAALVTLAGLATDQAPSDRLQRPAFIFALHTVDVAALDEAGRIRLAHQIAAAVGAGQLTPGGLGAQLRATGRGSEVYVTVDLAAGPDFDPLNPAQLAALEREGRQIATQLTAFLRAHHAAFRHAELAAFPTRVGLRESRRVRGRAVVTGADVLRGTARADAVALGTWPMELRERATGPRWHFPDANRPTQIPLDALRAAGAENVWAAGRCLSCDHEAQAALRVIGTCLATGEAAGVAAALQAAGCAEPTPAQVRAALESSGRTHAAECR